MSSLGPRVGGRDEVVVGAGWGCEEKGEGDLAGHAPQVMCTGTASVKQ